MTDKLNRLMNDIPQEVFNYINRYYADAFLSDFTYEMDEDYKVSYIVSASLEDTIYHFKFDSEGTMVNSTKESLLELSDQEYYDYD
jgi:hypothetical protein